MRLAGELNKRDEKAKRKEDREMQKKSIQRIVENSLGVKNQSKRNLMSSDEEEVD